jgi:hypothetical protein
MTFTKRLRDGVRRGEITCSVRIWTRPHVKVGGRYRMEEGEIEVDSVEPIGLPDITPQLARESGFLELSISSRWLTTVEAGTFSWCAFIIWARAANDNRDGQGVPAVRSRGLRPHGRPQPSLRWIGCGGNSWA